MDHEEHTKTSLTPVSIPRVFPPSMNRSSTRAIEPLSGQPPWSSVKAQTQALSTATDAIPKQSFGLESAYEISNADGGDKEMVVFGYGL